MKKTRNFCIIAHIDHGKSTLADRMLEITNTLTARDMENQVLDSMDLEKEKGITIKSHAIQMDYKYKGEDYTLNLIDTPGHVDFSYEVSRAIASCEGALLVVDATQGIQAQTISNLYLAIEHDLEIIPVLNKIDVESAMVDVVTDQVVDLLGCKPEDVLLASGKTGQGVPEVLDAIIERIPAPQGDPDAPLQALIFDSVFNSFRGIIAFLVVFGWVGVVMDGANCPLYATLPVATVCGFAIMVVLALIFRAVMKLRDDGNTDNRNAIGVSGKVHLTIPPARSGEGKVHVMLQGAYVERSAVTDETDAIPTGSEIVVIGVSGQTDLVVKRK